MEFVKKFKQLIVDDTARISRIPALTQNKLNIGFTELKSPNVHNKVQTSFMPEATWVK